jgi:hypothetical protein
VNDSRTGTTATRTQTVSGSQSLAFNVSQTEGGLGQFVIGTFVADATSQVLFFAPGNGRVVQLNGLQLRAVGLAEVPAPASAVLLAVGAGPLATTAYRRRREARTAAGTTEE